MDSFAEPQARNEYSLADVRDQVARLEDDHRAKGIPLSGRIIHVCHYLPFTATLAAPAPQGSQVGIPSPPQTPPHQPSSIPPSPTSEVPPPTAAEKAADDRWTIGVRYGHSAMVSGIASLSATHDQLFVGWTGDVYAKPSPPPTSPTTNGATSPPHTSTQTEFAKVSSDDVHGEEKDALERVVNARGNKLLLKNEFLSNEEGEGLRKNVEYVPVWLDDKAAHGHYEGYCKQSEFSQFISYLPFARSTAFRILARDRGGSYPKIPNLP